MEIKSLFDPVAKQEILDRIELLTPDTQRVWGKMDVAQMMAHLQKPIGVALGTHEVKGNFIRRLILPLFKKMLYDEKPYKRSLPTDKTFIITDPRIFEQEKKILMDMIHQFTPQNMATEVHPVFGRMTKENWSKAMWKHADHHLKQFGV
ncbi:MAG: DUF1569 domain-containing protein [Chitinophagaceae bacterium]|nr:DUF1569 domain-containing protein [Chitinophagaceae bacterium]